MSTIIPGILEQSWEDIEKKIELVLPFADTIHIDLLDGTFAENTSYLDPQPFKKYTDEIAFELHLMVDDPLSYVKPFAEAGFRRFLGHIEMMPNQTEFVALAESYGEVGLVLDAQTPIHELRVSLEDLDALLIMTVKAGFSGQKFLESSLAKVSQLRKEHPFLTVEVDGGINEHSLVQAYQAGARRFVATSAVFGAENPEKAYQRLSEIFAREEEASVSFA